MKRKLLLPVFILIFPLALFCQDLPKPVAPPPAPPALPKLVTYMCFYLPVVSTNSTKTTWNFNGTFTIGLASGINILYSDRFGFSFDIGAAVSTTNGLSKVTNVVFDPGPIFRLRHGYSIITRIALESAGRFGESTVFAKAITSSKTNSLFVALGIPIRFGNNLPASIGATLFFGIAFK